MSRSHTKIPPSPTAGADDWEKLGDYEETQEQTEELQNKLKEAETKESALTQYQKNLLEQTKKLETELEEANTKLEHKDIIISALKETYQADLQKLEQQLAQKNEEMKTNETVLKSKLTKAQNTLKIMSSERDKLFRDLAKLTAELAQIKTELDLVNTALEETEQTKATLETENTTLKATIESEKQQRQTLQTMFDSQTDDLIQALASGISLQRKNDTLQTQYKEEEAKKCEYYEENNELNKLVYSHETQIEALLTQKADLDKQIKSLKEQLTESIRLHKTAEIKKQEYHEDNNGLSKLFSELERNLAEQTNALKVEQEHVKSLKTKIESTSEHLTESERQLQEERTKSSLTINKLQQQLTKEREEYTRILQKRNQEIDNLNIFMEKMEQRTFNTDVENEVLKGQLFAKERELDEAQGLSRERKEDIATLLKEEADEKTINTVCLKEFGRKNPQLTSYLDNLNQKSYLSSAIRGEVAFFRRSFKTEQSAQIDKKPGHVLSVSEKTTRKMMKGHG